MTQFVVEKRIDAPIDRVFATVSDIRNMSEALPHVIRYEFLTEQQSGEGTRFREVRLMQGREEETELEVTEFVENDHVRMVSDSHGTIWDTVFKVREDGDQTRLTMTMDARPYKLMQRIMVPLIKGMVTKAVDNDMDMVKAYCEGSAE